MWPLDGDQVPAGALPGVRVLEIASDVACLTGKLLADLGADVVVVEPPGGYASRTHEPFVEDRPGPERSLWWWYYNTSKRSVVLDLEAPDGRDRFRELAAVADIVIEAEPPGSLTERGIGYPELSESHPDVIWVSVTPFGETGSRAGEVLTDLTLLAGAGPVWNCGYDDHELPPVRGGGNQGFHIAALFAALGALTALVHRDETGVGQHVDTSMHAAANVTTESGTFMWLVAEQIVQRQTGRHAAASPTMPVQVMAGDGRYVTTGFLPHDARRLEAIVVWLEQLGLTDEFVSTQLLRLGIERGGVDVRKLDEDVEGVAILEAAREALVFIASKISAYDFFIGAQERDMQCGIVYAPEEALEDPHFRERGFPVDVHHEDLGRTVAYPGAPFRMSASPWRVRRRAPHVGEHQAEILDGPEEFAEDAATPTS
jgi:crotonobetainyl-CoA:carnitine CoA-transferase CaiB-like acyl-CoA transferase